MSFILNSCFTFVTTNKEINIKTLQNTSKNDYFKCKRQSKAK